VGQIYGYKKNHYLPYAASSPHYNDLTDKWMKGEFKRMGWGKVEGKELRLES